MSRKPAQAHVEIPAPAKPSEHPRIVKKIPRETGFQHEAKQRNLAGVYRVIQGNVYLPRPDAEWKGADGKGIPGEPTLELAGPGDELYLGNEDALRLLSQNIVEELDAKPSRVPQYDSWGNWVEGTGVFKPPPVVHNANVGPGDSQKRYQGPAGARI